MTAVEYQAEFAQALHVWSSVADIQFRQVHTSQADLIVTFAPFETRSTLGQAKLSVPECAKRAIEKAFIRFNRDKAWLSAADVIRQRERKIEAAVEAESFAAVAIHEIGHVMGLPHCPDISSVMFPRTTNNLPGHTLWNFSLPTIDRSSILKLYEPAPPPPPPPPPPQQPAPKRSNCEQAYSVVHGPKIGDDEFDVMLFRRIARIRFPNADALATMRRVHFVFEGQQVWALNERGHVKSGYPTAWCKLFNLPKHLLRVDAAYELTNGRLMFFSGRRFYLMSAQMKLQRSGTLLELGLPANLPGLRDAFAAYLFDDSCLRFWRLNEKTMLVEFDYPRFIRL